MQKDQLFYLGTLGKPVGLKGEITFRFDCDNPENYKNLTAIFIQIKTGFIPYRVKNIRFKHALEAIFLFEEVDTIEKVNYLKGMDVYLPLNQLPALSGNKFYYHEIIGFDLIDKHLGLIGKVKDVLEYPQHDLFQVIHSSGKEVLLPVNDELIESLDRNKKTIYAIVPAGLVEIYLNDSQQDEEE